MVHFYRKTCRRPTLQRKISRPTPCGCSGIRVRRGPTGRERRQHPYPQGSDGTRVTIAAKRETFNCVVAIVPFSSDRICAVFGYHMRCAYERIRGPSEPRLRFMEIGCWPVRGGGKSGVLFKTTDVWRNQYLLCDRETPSGTTACNI